MKIPLTSALGAALARYRETRAAVKKEAGRAAFVEEGKIRAASQCTRRPRDEETTDGFSREEPAKNSRKG